MVDGPGERHVPAAVHGGHDQPRVRRKDLLRLGHRQPDRGHAAPAGRDRLGPAALRDHPRRLLKRQRADGVRGGDLPDAVPERDRPPHAPLTQHRGDPGLHREQHWLGHLGGLQPPLVRGPAQRRGDRPAEPGRQRAVDRVHFGAEHRVVQQIGRHPGPLRAVARENERDPATLDRLTRHAFNRHARARHARARNGLTWNVPARQELCGFARCRGQRHPAVAVRGPADDGGGGDVVELRQLLRRQLLRRRLLGRRLRPDSARQPGGQQPCRLHGRLRGTTRSDHRQSRRRDPRGRRPDAGSWHDGGWRADDHMGVRPAEPEGVDAHEAPTHGRCQRTRPPDRLQPQRGEVDARVEGFQVQRGGDPAVP